MTKISPPWLDGGRMGLFDELGRRFDVGMRSAKRKSILGQPAVTAPSGATILHLSEAAIRYRTVGTGPGTIVLAADPPVVIEQYDRLIDLLSPHVQVVVMEVPGFGFSLPDKSMRFDFTSANAVIAQFLQRLDLGPAVLAFPCVTAYAAVAIAHSHPHLVSGVVLIQAPSWEQEIAWKKARDPQGILGTPLLGQVALNALKRKRAPDWFKAAVGHRPMFKDLVVTTDEAFAHGACFCLASAFQRYLTDEAPLLSPVAQPSLVIWGLKDRSHATTDRNTSSQLAPGAATVDIAEAGHFPELEQPEQFATAVLNWMASEGLRPAA